MSQGKFLKYQEFPQEEEEEENKGETVEMSG
jgi:hypothetical protein